jgi:hypothetical protein
MLTVAGLMHPAGLVAVAAAQANGKWDALDHVEDLAGADLRAAQVNQPRTQRHPLRPDPSGGTGRQWYELVTASFASRGSGVRVPSAPQGGIHTSPVSIFTSGSDILAIVLS